MGDDPKESSDKHEKYKCKFCSESLDRRSVKCNSPRCNIYIHRKCLEAIAKVIFIDIKNWYCKFCVEDVKNSGLCSGNCVESEVIVLKKEVDCVTREKDLLTKMVTDMEYTIDLQKKMITDLETKTRIIDNVPSTSRISSDSARQTNISYSTVAKLKNTNKNEAVIFVKSANKTVSNIQVEKDVKSKINPGSLNININRTKLIKDGLLISCENKSSSDILKQTLTQKVGSTYTITEPRKLNPRIKIRGVEKDTAEATDFVNKLITDNTLSTSPEDIKYITKFNNGSRFDVILEVTPALFTLVIKRGFLYTGWAKCIVEEHVNLMRCFKCLKYGHLKKNCRCDAVVCPNCAGAHEKNNCVSESLNCNNCQIFNVKFKANFPTNHRATDRQCEYFKYKIDELKQKINYGEQPN